MSTLHLFETETEAQEETRPLSSRKRVAAAIAAVCLVASGGYVAARHSARNNDAVMTPPAQAAPSVTEEQAMPASQPDVAAPSAAPAAPNRRATCDESRAEACGVNGDSCTGQVKPTPSAVRAGRTAGGAGCGTSVGARHRAGTNA